MEERKHGDKQRRESQNPDRRECRGFYPDDKMNESMQFFTWRFPIINACLRRFTKLKVMFEVAKQKISPQTNNVVGFFCFVRCSSFIIT